jgi:ABC-type nitrate/sulfonate/bicarbonate transport system ATPase subunit
MTNRRDVLQLDLTGHSRGGVAILGPITLSVGSQETVALTGPSGIGKTTLLRLIAGLDPARGSVAVSGTVAVVFQEPTLLPWRSALDNLCLTTRVPKVEAQALLSEVGLGGLQSRFPGQLSLGQQRRLALARAFAARPALLLMDEPFVSLDPALADEMMALFVRLRSARPLATLIVTHVEAEAERLASRILRLGGKPATIVEDRQNRGADFRVAASGVTASRS